VVRNALPDTSSWYNVVGSSSYNVVYFYTTLLYFYTTASVHISEEGDFPDLQNFVAFFYTENIPSHYVG
jgi:hypothetical protein